MAEVTASVLWKKRAPLMCFSLKNKQIVFRFGSHCQGVKMSGRLQNKCALPFLQLSVSSLHINQRLRH